MTKLFAEVLGGPGQGDSAGGSGGGGGAGHSGHGKGGNGSGEGGGGSGENPKKAPRFPRVLLSSYDSDPLKPEAGAFDLDPRHPVVYQRQEDVQEGVYWINTSRPLAQRIIEQYKVGSTRWREYLFQRYVDIIVKEALYQKAKKESQLTAEIIDELIAQIVDKVHNAAAEDLEQFLFEEVVSQTTAGQPTQKGDHNDAKEG